MNFSDAFGLGISGHRDIDFADIRLDTDTSLYIDPERILLSDHPVAISASTSINDFFETVCSAASYHDTAALYSLLSSGREPNETHLGLSSGYSRGRGTSAEILLPIVENMIKLGLFERQLITQLSDFHLWTPNFGYDRLSDLTTNIIRAHLYDYTLEQFSYWNIVGFDTTPRILPTWDSVNHCWAVHRYNYPCFGSYDILLVPKEFIGPSMLSTPGELLQKYALSFRQQEHLIENSPLCHTKERKTGRIDLLPPTKRELRQIEIGGQPSKPYMLEIGYRHPEMVRQLHFDHYQSNRRSTIVMEDYQLDQAFYGDSADVI